MAVTTQERELADGWIEYFTETQTETIETALTVLDSGDYLDEVPVTVDFEELEAFDEDFADDLRTHPQQVLDAAERAFKQLDQVEDAGIVSTNDIAFQITNLPTLKIRDLTHEHLGKLVTVEGLVQQATDPKPRFLNLAFECLRCGTLTHIKQSSDSLNEPHECQGCERQGPFQTDMSQTEHVHHQRLRVQESPEGLRGGKDPRSIDVHVEGSLVDNAAPGDHVTLTGVMTYPDPANTQGDAPLAEPYLQANNISTESDAFGVEQITEDEKKQIHDFADRPDAVAAVVDSIAPTIFGYNKEKLAIALQLFAGVRKHVNDKSIRGDIHIFLVGDPGTAKSQLLHFVNEIMPRSSYTTGEGSSKAGLTGAAVQSDLDGGGSWTIEAGVLVLSDQGIACVDELDKLDEGTDALHSALEQQKVSIAKAGINTSMNARCGLLAAANPKYGRWDDYEPVPEQVDLPAAIVSRFDLIFTLKDEPDKDFDSDLAESILNTNRAGQKIAAGDNPDNVEELQEPEIPLELLPKYIMYARNAVDPTLTDAAMEKLKDFYVDMRSTAEDSDAIPVTARKLEASVRLAEASARIRLSEDITEDDADLALEIIKYSLEEVGVDPETGELDADMVETGTPETQRQRIRTIQDLISEMEQEEQYDEGVPREEAEDRAEEIGIEPDKFDKEVDKLRRSGELYEPKSGHLRST